MRFGLKDSVLQRLVGVLAKNETVSKALIFGSRAIGDYRYNSDIDLALYFNGEMPIGLTLDLDEAVGIYKIDVVDMGRLSNLSLRQRIEDQGIEIYRRV